jgi:hypothetical protein
VAAATVATANLGAMFGPLQVMRVPARVKAAAL